MTWENSLHKTALFRILVSVLLLFSVLFLPFWVTVLLALAGMIYFSVFWEAVVLFLLSDSLYGVGKEKYFGLVFVSFIASFIILILIEILKKKIKFYPNTRK
jgi:hypothetical protein